MLSIKCMLISGGFAIYAYSGVSSGTFFNYASMLIRCIYRLAHV